MKTCPFCKREFEFKDLLFFSASISGSNTKDSVRSTVQVDEDFGGGRSGSRGEIGGHRGGGRKPKVEQTAVEEKNVQQKAVEDNGVYGIWTVDKVYQDTCSRFWKSNELGQERRFIVRWTDGEAQKGVAKADLWSAVEGSGEKYPTTVKLGDEDGRASGLSNRTLTRVMCPHCHCEILTRFLATPDENCHSIALIGYPSSGKTQFKLALRNELLTTLKNKCRLVSSIEVFSESNKFIDVENGKFRNGEAEATAVYAVVFPMIFAIKSKNNQSHLITLYDMPGEAYVPENNNVLAEHTGLRGVDGAFLMVDAVQLHEVIRSNNKVMVTQDGETSNRDIQFVRENVNIVEPLEYFAAYGIGMGIEYLSLIVTKADLLISNSDIKYFGDERYRKQLAVCRSDISADHRDRVSMGTIKQVDEQVMRAISELDFYTGMNVKQAICDKMPMGSMLKEENIRAFAISTLRRPDPETAEFTVQDEASYVRHRLLEPILYLMAQWGMVETKQSGAVEADPKPPKPEPKETRKKHFWQR